MFISGNSKITAYTDISKLSCTGWSNPRKTNKRLKCHKSMWQKLLISGKNFNTNFRKHANIEVCIKGHTHKNYRTYKLQQIVGGSKEGPIFKSSAKILCNSLSEWWLANG